MESYWEDITPERAAEYLRGNAAGRSLNQSAVAMYARDMAQGHWQLTHQGVALDEDDVLFDGQHRMAAIIRAGVPVRMWVTRGADRSTFSALDIGRNRSMANHFQIAGYDKHATQLAAVARRATLWLAGMPWNKKFSPTRNEIAATVEKHPDLADAARFAHAWPPRRTLSPAVAGFCWWLFKSIDEYEANDFMERLRTGESLESGDPILALRDRLIGERTNAPRGDRTVLNRPSETQQALAIIAWNAYRKRKKVTVVRLPSSMSDESFPRPI